MSAWTHAICVACWNKLRPETPAQDSDVGRLEDCCWCGAKTEAGIYLRGDPKALLCKGEHREEI